MPTAIDLKEDGFIEYRELVEKVAAVSHVHPSTLAKWLSSPLSKLRGVLVQDGHIVQADDRTWQCQYNARLVNFLAAYVKWHRFGTRHSVVEVVGFYNDFNARAMNSLVAA